MKTVLFLVLLTFAAGAQDRVEEMLRKGIIEEETNHDLSAAVKTYTAALAAFEQDRRAAGTALFRLAECYRKLGRKELAIAAYQRVIRDFADQPKLAQQSQSTLARAYGVQASAGPGALTPEIEQARRNYRDCLEKRVTAIEANWKYVQAQVKLGAVSDPETYQPQAQLAAAKAQVALFDAGLVAPLPAGPGTPQARQQRQAYRKLLEEQVAFEEQNAEAQKKMYELGMVQQQEIVKSQINLYDARCRLAAFEAGLSPVPAQ